MQQQITLQLDVFEGPLDLLLYLIKKNDLEISRISISVITDQYLSYLDELEELDIDIASDYLFMAAELAHIKSRTLLPHDSTQEEDEDDEVGGDLVARLKEYERYKLAAGHLKERRWLNRDVFTRGAFIEEEITEEDKIEKTKELGLEEFDVDSFELIKAFHEVLNRLPKGDVNHKVISERVSVTERIYEVLDVLKDKDSMVFSDFFAQDRTKIDVVVTFLALLEMGKLKMVRIYQPELFGTIRVQRRIDMDQSVLDNKDILEQLEQDFT